MNRIAVFGKPGGGKSTLSIRLSAATGIRYFPLDLIEFRADGKRVSRDKYEEAHESLVSESRWIIDGLGTIDSFWARIDAADTLVYIDLPYPVHYWWATKRLLTSPMVKPKGWPDGSSVLKGTWASYKYLRLSRRFWTEKFLSDLERRAGDRNLFRIATVKALNSFVDDHSGVSASR